MGCEQSVPVDSGHRKPIQGVGQTERLVGRAERLTKGRNVNNSDSKRVLHPTSSMVGKPDSTSSTASSQGSSMFVTHLPKLDPTGRLLPEEVVRRTNGSIVTHTIVLGTAENPLQVEYAHWTQRGYYPDDPHKENQDEFSITTSFAGEHSGAMLGVYDGHGKHGHDCASFVKKKLPSIVGKYVRQARVKKYQTVLKKQGKAQVKLFDPLEWPYLDAAEYKACCEKAFLECNDSLRNTDVVDAKMSGTTAITAHFHGKLMTICNVGDSRAVLGHRVDEDIATRYNRKIGSTPSEEEKKEVAFEALDGENQQTSSAFPSGKVFPENGKLLAIPLSRDQTPYRKDERERVKKLGAAVLSIDQMEGVEEIHENWGDMVLGEDVDIHGDPPRVWVEGKDYPGTAFTRSLGDSLAEGIGVTAQPEMLTRELTMNDHILIIASDGIFEFIRNQHAIDLCASCRNPVEACERLVKAAYDQWLTYENRTDDITVIVCFLTTDKLPPTDGSEGTTEDLVILAKSMYGNKPIRKMRGKSDNLTVSQYASTQVAMTLSKEDIGEKNHQLAPQ